MRIASIMDVARQGAAGLSLDPNPRDGTEATLRDMLFGQWNIPIANSSEPRWLDIQICSSRAVIDPNSTTIAENSDGRRFVMITDDTDPPVGHEYGYRRQYCMHNESNTAAAIDNSGLRWYDPGNPGDRIELFLTYNHPLITPLGLAEYVPMSAVRSGVNEDFRQSRALEAVQGAPPGLGGVTNTPLPAV